MQITFDGVSHVYKQTGEPDVYALKDVSFEIPSQSYTAIIGHTGSGKSTIVQHLNALLKPTSGQLIIGDRTITKDTSNKNLKALRKKVGVVFQFPESQLFDETVLKDVMFGPKNFGISDKEAEKMAREALALVGLTDEDLLERSPFDLSGGQMRRVAIAGVLAMQPEVLVLDEPTAGLDPKSRLQMMSLFEHMKKERNITIVLITHQMNDVAEYADHVVVMAGGEVVKMGQPDQIFKDQVWLENLQLGEPASLSFLNKLANKAHLKIEGNLPMTLEELTDYIVNQVEGENQHV